MTELVNKIEELCLGNDCLKISSSTTSWVLYFGHNSKKLLCNFYFNEGILFSYECTEHLKENFIEANSAEEIVETLGEEIGDSISPYDGFKEFLEDLLENGDYSGCNSIEHLD